MNTPDDAPTEVHGVPIVVIDGRLRLAPRPPICHGYANCCQCPECDERERETTPDDVADDELPARPDHVAQPWEPRPPRHQDHDTNRTTTDARLTGGNAQRAAA